MTNVATDLLGKTATVWRTNYDCSDRIWFTGLIRAVAIADDGAWRYLIQRQSDGPGSDYAGFRPGDLVSILVDDRTIVSVVGA